MILWSGLPYTHCARHPPPAVIEQWGRECHHPHCSDPGTEKWGHHVAWCSSNVPDLRGFSHRDEERSQSIAQHTGATSWPLPAVTLCDTVLPIHSPCFCCRWDHMVTKLCYPLRLTIPALRKQSWNDYSVHLQILLSGTYSQDKFLWIAQVLHCLYKINLSVFSVLLFTVQLWSSFF